MEFIKMHGLGNDFVFLDHFSIEPEEDYSELARKLCDRHFGIGADGLAVVLPSKAADARMRIFNPDGSEPEMCGNAIRCFAKYLFEKGYVSKNPLKVETLAGVLTLQLSLKDAKVDGVTVDMGEPVLKPALIPVIAQGEPIVGGLLDVDGKSFEYTAVSMGNPHAVIFVDDVNHFDFKVWGPKIENHSAFPRKTNVEFVEVNSRDELTMMVWERGAGPTLACGTGACAVTVAAVLNQLANRKVTVHLPGGDLLIEWSGDNHVYMTGPAAYVFKGYWLAD